ncbi:peptidoglycan DD-metalloendopeptidase family protein [Tianweitania sp. BSSL-BM11]|uniref:Peptidoglycan DD-metalloendopeptidase family protein n=1 Tax=Tianweitania aestuarii TaxID=2814886 RepID=A0ABS5RUD8_9HYPH|nr:M23 family metallopeptidase [Tianweitania aestuarii]MBS9720669.1 peptidoglycan DD-metalloendopeptidase family protein [Tianweitania aestuarii]
MQLKVLNGNGRLMLRGAALLLAGVAAGCSSGVSRFTSDMFTTSSTGTQTASAAPANQSYGQPSALPAAPSGSVQRSAMAPVSMSGGQSGRSSLPPLSPAASDAPMGSRNTALQPTSSQSQPVQVASLPKAAPSLPSAPTNTAKAPTRGGSYTVESGDTLSGVSRKTGVSVDNLKAANGLSDGNIRIGQTLVVPGVGAKPAQTQLAAAPKPLAAPGAPAAPAAAPAAAAPQVATAKPAEAPAQQASYTPPKQTARAIVEDSDAEAPGGTGIGKMRWPVRGKVIGSYGKGAGKAGDGIDIAVPEGTPVKAAENGVVIYAGDGLKEFGNTVLVRHENGLVTVYGHASSLKVQRGQTVKRGQELALSGMSGSTESPKLHFEVRKNSSPVDPSTFLE